MAISTNLEYALLDDLKLDPTNPRLGRNNTGYEVSQDDVLNFMRDWTLDELARSYMESGGFWTHEALLVVQEELYGKPQLVVVEGNRRLAALIFLNRTFAGLETSKKWSDIIEGYDRSPNLFDRIPYLKADSRQDVEAFLGFRHVTGIKEWKPTEKAEFIAKLIDERGLSYDEVRRKIGSKTPTVRQNYIAYRLLLQIENTIEEVPPESYERRFSVMYLSLRTPGTQEYLDFNIHAEPEDAKKPVAEEKRRELGNFAQWVFGTETKPPLFTDSRKVDDFGIILKSSEARQYLERTEKPKFAVGYRIAGGDEDEVIKLIEQASDNVELALSRAHFYKTSPKVQRAVERLGINATQLLKIYPDIRKQISEG